MTKIQEPDNKIAVLEAWKVKINDAILWANEDFVQPTLIAGPGAHNVLLQAAVLDADIV